MRILRPRQSFSLDYTPKQWVGVCNTVLLLLVTAMCGMVIYQVYNLDQRFVSVVDSSISINHFLSMAKINTYRTPYWRNATSAISLYSAFYKKMASGEDVILIVSSTSYDDIRFRNLRCLIKYDENEDLTVTYVQHQKVANCTSLFLYCVSKNSKIPKKVAIVSYASNTPIPWIPIDKVPSKMDVSPGPPKIAACVRPLTKYVSVREIADFVAFYEVLGINHFYFYDYTLSHDAVAFLRQLVATGHSINLLPWNKDRDIHADCHIGFSEYVQDCLHRATHRYNYVFTTDIFDYFVPTRYFRLLDLFDVARNGVENTRLKRANFCNLFRSNNRSSENDSVRNMVFRGEYYTSPTNYILRPELMSAIDFYESLEIKDQSITFPVLSEYDGVIRHLTRKCDANANLDTTVAKYISALDKSLVIEAYKHTPEGNTQLSTPSNDQ